MTGRSDRYVSAILPSPYCQLVSDLWVNATSYHYALSVRDGSVAWQWPLAPLGDVTQAVQLLPSASPHRVYALESYYVDELQLNGTACGVIAALHSGNGSAIWQHELCYPHVAGVNAAFTVVPSPHSSNAAGERIVLIIGNIDLPFDVTETYMLVDVLQGNTGRHLSSANLSDVVGLDIQSIGHSAGYFSIDNVNNRPRLFQLTADGNVTSVSDQPVALVFPALLSQPALRYDNPNHPTQLEAHDVADDKQVWASGDDFLTGIDWGTNDTFTHYSTSYQLVDTQPSLFIVLNTAYNNGDNNKTVVAQAGVYHLSSGKQVSRSPLLSFEHLYHPDANPSTWQFNDTLLLRGDTVWYVLRLPSLEVVNRGEYVTSDAAVNNNNWVVDPDGSYVALVYRSDEVHGYPPYVTGKAPLSTEQSAPGQHRHVNRG